MGWDGVSIMKVYWKIRFLRKGGGGGGVFTKNQYTGGNCLKGAGAWRALRFKGGLAKKRGIWYPNAHYDITNPLSPIKQEHLKSNPGI